MELKDLLGLHILSGVDKVTAPYSDLYPDSCEVFNFVLDGKTFTAVEDPEDGYRSCMKELFVSDTPVINNFTGQQVLAVFRKFSGYTKDDVLDLYDTTTGQLVLSVGTESCDDYYPMWVAEFHPENMAINNLGGEI